MYPFFGSLSSVYFFRRSPTLCVFLFLIFGSFPALGNFEQNKWFGDGFPIFAYKQTETTLYTKPDLSSDSQTILTKNGQMIDYGSVKIITKQPGKIVPRRSALFQCFDKAVTFTPQDRITLLYRDHLHIILQKDEIFCKLLYRKQDSRLLYKIEEEAKTELWLEVHANDGFTKGWLLVQPKNLRNLPHLPTYENHNNRRGISGNFRDVKIISESTKGRVSGYINLEYIKKDDQENLKIQCQLFFEGDLSDDVYLISGWTPGKNKLHRGKMKYNWRGNKAFLIVETEPVSYICASKTEQERADFGDPPQQIITIFPLKSEGNWQFAIIAKNDETLFERPDGEQNKQMAIKKYDAGIVIDKILDWRRITQLKPVSIDGWLQAIKMEVLENIPELACKFRAEIPNSSEEYMILTCKGDIKREQGDYEQAISYYERSLDFKFKNQNGDPIPNYNNYAEITGTQCQAGDKSKFAAREKEYRCMRQIEVGLISCFKEGSQQRNLSEQVGQNCFSRMCEESFLPLYSKKIRNKKFIKKQIENSIQVKHRSCVVQ